MDRTFSHGLPVNNILAERHFNLSQLYLNDNRSELSKQASATFVGNILHSGKTNTRTTEVALEVHEERMKEYAQLLTTTFCKRQDYASCVFQMSSSLQLLVFPRHTCLYILHHCLHIKNRVVMGVAQ